MSLAATASSSYYSIKLLPTGKLELNCRVLASESTTLLLLVANGLDGLVCVRVRTCPHLGLAGRTVACRSFRPARPVMVKQAAGTCNASSFVRDFVKL